jgi:hypothetical protein
VLHLRGAKSSSQGLVPRPLLLERGRHSCLLGRVYGLRCWLSAAQARAAFPSRGKQRDPESPGIWERDLIPFPRAAATHGSPPASAIPRFDPNLMFSRACIRSPGRRARAVEPIGGNRMLSQSVETGSPTATATVLAVVSADCDSHCIFLYPSPVCRHSTWPTFDNLRPRATQRARFKLVASALASKARLVFGTCSLRLSPRPAKTSPLDSDWSFSDGGTLTVLLTS